MVGEAHDLTFPEESPVSSQNVFVSTRVLEIALIWILIYYVVILPLRILHVDPASIAEYDNGLLKPRCSVFENFRQYENMHMLLWILKDLAWIRNNIALWAISLAPTILVAVDFIILASSRRNKVNSVP